VPRIAAPWRHWDDAALRRSVGVYVHIPFCPARCSYCDFLTYASDRPAGMNPETYAAALLLEIERRGRLFREHYGPQHRVVDTVFIGGGTPTFLTPDALAGVVSAVREHFAVAPGAEITSEANPDTVTPEHLTALAAAGVNRISLGVQSTQERHLKFMRRTHRWQDIVPVLRMVAAGPVPRYSFDLIYGVPRQTLGELKQSLRRLLAFSPRHISAYCLTREPGTPYSKWLKRFPQLQAREATVVDQQHVVQRLLGAAGLYRYEVSNYAWPGEECRHNLRYWRGGDYFGLGLGAASRIGDEVLNNPYGWPAYQQRVEKAGGAEDPLAAAIDAAQLADIRGLAPPADLFLRLRTRAGFQRNGHALEGSWLGRGWLRTGADGQVEVTRRGMGLADYFARELA
jgi:oxygen-independent coproporphyrinogen-3 oxidase